MLGRGPPLTSQGDRLAKATPFPKICHGAHAHVTASRREFYCVIHQVRNHVLKLELVKQDRLQAGIWAELPAKPLLFEAARPMLQNLRNALVYITEFFGDADLARFKCAEGEKVLNETLQTEPTLLHFLQDFPLLFAQRSE